ncbi:MAG TPA: sigma-70 family RNA polymerase sigma factor [Gemmatimonadales bacterium]|nr:sigma-70 family RNA polymerase sigma factor [Gemmatimonadales bacterium]
MSELELVRRAQAGEEAAFERLYRDHAGRVYALCLRLSGDPARAQELVQDVFVRVWRRLESFRGDSAFGTWLHRLAVNVVLMDHRAVGRRERRVESRENLAAAEPPGREAPAGLRVDLERAIAALPDGAREVFVLHDVEGYRHEEIAALVGIAVGTSKAQLFRARRLLRRALEP